MSKKIKNIIFDIGDVLVRFDETGHALKLFDSEKAQRILDGLWIRGIGDDFDRGILNEDFIIEKYIALLPDIEEEVRTFIKTIGECIYQYSYAIPWIKELKENGFNVYFLSNYSDWFYKSNMDALSFIPYMDGGIFSYKCHYLKPEEEIFNCLYETYRLDPKECFFIDDLIRNIYGAKKTGMDGYVFKSYEEDYSQIMKILNCK